MKYGFRPEATRSAFSLAKSWDQPPSGSGSLASLPVVNPTEIRPTSAADANNMILLRMNSSRKDESLYAERTELSDLEHGCPGHCSAWILLMASMETSRRLVPSRKGSGAEAPSHGGSFR